MFKKMFGSISNKIKEFCKGGAESAIVVLLAIVVVIFLLLLWFFCACYNWTVLAFPLFCVFPKWAFVLLMFILSSGSRGGK